ncbi:MAG: TldD/PmbA family protein [Chloroflexi bacterium]|nr:TldD/PmbA family protein [Chloroflexota bacterium]
MIGSAKVRALLEDVLRRSKADQTEVLLMGQDAALTRFANSAIHQNVFERNAELRVRAVVGKRVGVAATNDLSEAGRQRAAERALAIAERQPENPDFPGLPQPAPIPSVHGYAASTAGATPEQRALSVKTICDLALEQQFNASGALRTDCSEIAVANSLGVFAYDTFTSTSLKTVMMGPDEGSGYAERASVDMEQLDVEALAREAVDKTLRSRGPGALPAGEYPVILEEYAVAELLDYLAYVGFGALSYQEGHGFMAGRLGQRLVSERISIWDDGLDPRGTPMGFDFEGVPKQRVDLIRAGVAAGVVYDTQTAAREGRQSTGHALPAPNSFGPFPMHLFMAPGEASREAMLRSIDRGLWVTRFHYVNVVHPRQAILTGMTRDGTFLIERGELARPVRNLRFTQNALEALASTQAVGDRLLVVGGFGGATVVPALQLGRFTFTGVSSQ